MGDPVFPESWCARSIAVETPTLQPELSCKEALDRFNAAPNIFALPVLRDGKPCGLVNRASLTTIFAEPLSHELYENRPVSVLMDRNPLVVEGDTPVSALSELIYKMSPAAMVNGFIVTENGQYLGIGNGLDLLRRMTEQLQERNLELNEAMHRALAANTAKSQFLAHMSHELRTPLNAVLGFSEIIARELLGPLGQPKYREYAHDIHGSASHLLNLINGILDLSKAEAGKFELDLNPTDLAGVIQECLRLFSVRVQESKLRLECHMPKLPLVLADELKLKQIVINLLANAVKFTPEGGTVTIELHRKSVAVFQLSVSDTGIGMMQEDIAKALSPFGQINNSMTRRYPGTGLGLPLAKALVELHGGTLRIASAPESGTTVLITLPLALADAAEPRSETA